MEDELKKDENELVLDEMEELTNAMDRKKKRTKRLLAKRRAKVSSLVQLTLYIFSGCSTSMVVYTNYKMK